MTMRAGTRIGPYEVVTSLGAGGMGEVWRAHDSRLKRDVALKVLPVAFAADPDRLARFQREAEVLATLNHPNIAAIYGLEVASAGVLDGADRRALVLELVDGETLAERVSRGALSVADTLLLARQMCDALDYAHERGVLHRDFKPSNLKVTESGQLKVLDFGLAKLAERVTPDATADHTTISPAGAHAHSPILSEAGMLLGTAAYMSPEQARARPVDRRADVWAFGCTLFELLSGRRPFEGETVTDVLAAVVSKEPKWDRLQHVPPLLRDLIRRCLTKDARSRLRDIGDAKYEIERCLAPGEPSAIEPAMPRRTSRQVIPWLAAGAFGLLAAAAWMRAPSSAPAMRLVQVPGAVGSGAALDRNQGPAMALSKDGSRLVFVARAAGEARHLFVRTLDQVNPIALPDTTNAMAPFFSPDGQWVAFFADGKLKKVPAAGGAVVVLCDAPNGRGGSWGDDDAIVFSPNSAGGIQLQRVPATGGSPAPVTPLAEGEVAQRWPQVLPGARAILFTSATNLGNYDVADIAVLSLPGGQRHTLIRGGYFGRVTPSGHLTFVRQGRLFVAAFDASALRVIGDPAPVLESVSVLGNTGAAQVAMADNGTAVYVPANAGDAAPLQWLHHSAGVLPDRSAVLDWSSPRVSPDGSRVAVDIFDGRQTDLWTYEWARDALARLTFDPAEDWYPLWSPDGSRIAYRSSAELAFNLYWINADGSGGPERLLRSSNPQLPTSWHPSGAALLYTETNPVTNRDVMLLPFETTNGVPVKAKSPVAVFATPVDEHSAAFSPDGHWIAYIAGEAGTSNLYVRSYGEHGGGQWLIARDAADPTWSRTKPELLFMGADQRLRASTYAVSGSSFRASPPRPWAPLRAVRRPRGPAGGDGRSYDLHPDGTRAVGAWENGEAGPPTAGPVFVFNFFDELRRLAPLTR